MKERYIYNEKFTQCTDCRCYEAEINDFAKRKDFSDFIFSMWKVYPVRKYYHYTLTRLKSILCDTSS